MGHYSIDVEVKHFLDKYYAFEIVEYPNKRFVVLEGKIDIVDDANDYWGSFDIQIILDREEYPYTIPIVTEKSNIIDRSDDLHISKEGICCLDIPHVLERMKRRGISFRSFYKEVIYPFFSNYHYYSDKKRYANGEYKHGFYGIVQYYEEEHELKDKEYIISLLKIAVSKSKPERNSTCPICGKPKFKKCCGKKILELLPYGRDRLEKDLKIFRDLTLRDEKV